MIYRKTLSLLRFFAQTGKAQQSFKDVKIAQKGPYKLQLQAGKNYNYCQCGFASEKSQPFCDSTHNKLKGLDIPKSKRFQVEKDGEYYLCGCKASKELPYCDGSHELL